MLPFPSLGSVTEIVTNRHWAPADIRAQIDARARAYQALGVAPGDRVLVHFGNQLELFADVLAIWQIGGCVIPLDPRLTPFEVATIAKAASARARIVNDETGSVAVPKELGLTTVHTAACSSPDPRSAPASQGPRLDDAALILFTSGSTGDPKGVVHTHRSLLAKWLALRQSLGTGPYARTLCILPTHFGHGLICNCLFPWLSGCDLFVAPPSRTDVLTQLGKAIDDYGITFMSSVPSMWHLVLRAARSPEKGSLRRVQIGSAPLSADMWRQVIAWSRVPDVVNSYGITETGSWMAGTTHGGVVPEDGLIGVPWGATIRVLEARSVDALRQGCLPCATDEPGMVWLHTPSLMQGYLHRDDLTDAVVYHGWFMTGDIGVIDSRGRLILRGRERDEINKGGTKVYPADIEAVVQQLACVTDVCAFAIDDARYGENVAMALVLENGQQENLAKVYDWISAHLTEHKRPVRWYVLDRIERTSRGKIKRDRIREICRGQTPVELGGVLRKARQPAVKGVV